jgi:hypothetical protein
MRAQREMGGDQQAGGFVERPGGVAQQQVVADVKLHAHCPAPACGSSAARSLPKASLIRDFTVPTGNPSRLAISP